LKSETIDKMVTIANQWLISICNIIIYLEIKFRPNRRIFIFWPPFWPPKYKNPPIWTKFGFQVDYDIANWYPSLVYYGGHVESKMAAKIHMSYFL
jgi:hypothetical protein